MERMRDRWVKTCPERCTGNFFLCLPMRNGCCLMVWYHMIMSLLAAVCAATDFRVAAINNYIPIMALNSSIALLYHMSASLIEFTLGSAILAAVITMKDLFLYFYMLVVLLWAMVAVTFAILEAERMLPDRNDELRNHDIANIVASCINAVLACYFAWAALLQTYLLKEARDKRDREMQQFLEELKKIRRIHGLPDLTPSDLKLLQRKSFFPGTIASDIDIPSRHVSVHDDEDLEQVESRSENKALQGSGGSEIRSLSNLLGQMDEKSSKQKLERKLSRSSLASVDSTGDLREKCLVPGGNSKAEEILRLYEARRTYGELYPDIMTVDDETSKTTLRTACGKCKAVESDWRTKKMLGRLQVLEERSQPVHQRVSVVSPSPSIDGSGRSETLEGRKQGSLITIKSDSDISRGSELLPVETEGNQQSRARPPHRFLSNLMGHMYEKEEVVRITSETAGAWDVGKREVATVYPEAKKGDVMAASSASPRELAGTYEEQERELATVYPEGEEGETVAESSASSVGSSLASVSRTVDIREKSIVPGGDSKAEEILGLDEERLRVKRQKQTARKRRIIEERRHEPLLLRRGDVRAGPASGVRRRPTIVRKPRAKGIKSSSSTAPSTTSSSSLF